MSKLIRQTMQWFGSSSDSSSVGVFGSLAASSPTYSKVISTIQSLPAWGSGWKAEVIASQRPAIQDFNAVDYVFSYGICYLHEMGIPEWDSGTVYYQNSYCQVSGVVYYSLQDTNLNQNPTTATSYWTAGVLGISTNYVDLTSAQNVGGVKTFTSFPVTPTAAPTTSYQVSNKKYVDDQIAGLIPTKASLGIDSGTFTSEVEGNKAVSFNFTFASPPIVVCNAYGDNGHNEWYFYISSVSTTGFNHYNRNGSATTFSYIAIGTHA